MSLNYSKLIGGTIIIDEREVEMNFFYELLNLFIEIIAQNFRYYLYSVDTCLLL